jgi:hypothetical protein
MVELVSGCWQGGLRGAVSDRWSWNGLARGAAPGQWWRRAALLLVVLGTVLAPAPAQAQLVLGPFNYHWRDTRTQVVPPPPVLGFDTDGSGLFFELLDPFPVPTSGSRGCYTLDKRQADYDDPVSGPYFDQYTTWAIRYIGGPICGATFTDVAVISGNGNSYSATITVAITNNPPVYAGSTETATVGQAVTLNPLANASDSNGDPVTLKSIGTQTGPGCGAATRTGNTIAFTGAAAGVCDISVTVTDTVADASGIFRVTVAKAAQTINFTSTAPPGAQAGGATYTPTATATSGLPVTFTVEAASSAVCAIASGVVSFTGAGSCVLNADQPGNDSFLPAPQVQQSFAVATAVAVAQTISFTSAAPTNARAGGASYTPIATATSGLAVVFTLDGSSTGCSLSGGVVSFTGAGTCRVNANQPGNAAFLPAPRVQQSFAVTAASVAPAPIPTLSEWTMIILSLMLAGGAALYIHRRRAIA